MQDKKLSAEELAEFIGAHPDAICRVLLRDHITALERELEFFTANSAKRGKSEADYLRVITGLEKELEEAREALTRIAALSSHEFSPPDLQEDLTRWETTHQRIARLAKEALGQGPWPRDAQDPDLSSDRASLAGQPSERNEDAADILQVNGTSTAPVVSENPISGNPLQPKENQPPVTVSAKSVTGNAAPAPERGAPSPSRAGDKGMKGARWEP